MAGMGVLCNGVFQLEFPYHVTLVMFKICRVVDCSVYIHPYNIHIQFYSSLVGVLGISNIPTPY